MPPTEVEDGELPYGSFEVVIIETGERHVAENFSIEPNSKKLQTMGIKGKVRRQKILDTDDTFTADFQLDNYESLAPRRRSTFAVDADNDGNVEPYQVEKGGRSYTQDDVTKCKVSGFAMVNPLPYKLPATEPSGDLAISPIAIAGANTGDLFTAMAHGLANGTRVTLKVLTGLTGLADLTTYYIIAATADTFQLAATVGGMAEAISADGTGTVTVGVDFAAYLPVDVEIDDAPWSATGLPTGLTIDATTGQISGDAGTPGVYKVAVKCSGTREVDGVTETLRGVRKFTWTVT